MASERAAEQAGPARTAQDEAVKQAVGLIFTVATVVVLIPLSRKMHQQQAQAVREELTTRFDPVMRKIADAEAARDARARKVRYWHRMASTLWPWSSAAAVWALRRAESVSKAPEASEG